MQSFLTRLTSLRRLTNLRISKVFESSYPENPNNATVSTLSHKEEVWTGREKLFKPTIQRMEKQVEKIYYSPEWKLDQSLDNEIYSPLKNYGTTPEKWEYYNKVFYDINMALLIYPL